MEDKTVHLLLIEDDKVDRMAFERYVRSEKLNYDYRIARSVAEGREILQIARFDVIIADYMLGDGVSFELFELFRAAPVIVTTGTGNEEVAVEAMKLGASDYLIKDPEGNYLKTLPTTVLLALERKKNEKELQKYHDHLESMVKERTAELQAEITKRKRIGKILRKSEEQWNRTFNAITDIITLQDVDLKVVKANEATCIALDLSYDKIVGHHCYELFEGLDEPCQNCPLLQTKETFTPYSREMFHNKLGKTYLVSASPVFDEQGTLEYITHVAKDISNLKKLEENLAQAQKMEAIGTLAGGIAHDFNNILSAIIGYSELIKNEVPANSNIGKDIAQVIASGMRAGDLVNQILTISRKADNNKQPLRPHLIVKEVMKMMHATIPTSITIEENIDRDCEKIWANATNIHQIVVNLCTNALHAMADQKGTLSVSLQRRVLSSAETYGEISFSSGPFVALTVDDTGSGMNKTTLDRIFDPYFTTKEIGKGTGLGLAVVQGIVRDIQGFIKVKSTPGEGSSFSVYFPVLQKMTSTKHEPEQLPPPQGGNEHILVVDDELFLVLVMQRQLENMGYQVTTATNSKNALEKFSANPEQFDLLITDQTMPGLTGAELALTVMGIKPDLPVLLCSGHSDLVSQDKALELGIKQYVPKPIVGNELLRTVRLVLDGK